METVGPELGMLNNQDLSKESDKVTFCSQNITLVGSREDRLERKGDSGLSESHISTEWHATGLWRKEIREG